MPSEKWRPFDAPDDYAMTGSASTSLRFLPRFSGTTFDSTGASVCPGANPPCAFTDGSDGADKGFGTSTISVKSELNIELADLSEVRTSSRAGKHMPGQHYWLLLPFLEAIST